MIRVPYGTGVVPRNPIFTARRRFFSAGSAISQPHSGDFPAAMLRFSSELQLLHNCFTCRRHASQPLRGGFTRRTAALLRFSFVSLLLHNCFTCRRHASQPRRGGFTRRTAACRRFPRARSARFHSPACRAISQQHRCDFTPAQAELRRSLRLEKEHDFMYDEPNPESPFHPNLLKPHELKDVSPSDPVFQ